VEIGELGSLVQEAECLGLYSFSPEWKQTYLQWCYDNQDEETGLWGARSRRDNTLLHGGDVVDSEKMISKFIDSDGNEIYPEFPLRYRENMFATVLEKLSGPMPDDLDELHDWILTNNRGIRFLTRYLWKNATVEEKDATRARLEEFVKIRFEFFYLNDEGAFSLYPHAAHADLDGTGEALSMLYKDTGALSEEKHHRLWGDPKEYVIDLGTYEISDITKEDFALITPYSEINSLRFYASDPNSQYLEDVKGVFYPKETSVLDIVDVVPKVEKWVKTTSQNMGNWVTKESILQNLLAVRHIKAVPVSYDMPLELANAMLHRHSLLVVIGFDMLQVPRYKIVYTLGEQ
jgi:hypothetical protein